MTALQVCDLTFAYRDAEVFSDVTFALQRGTITAILGANGCGKTTLLRCIGGTLSPQRGTARVAAVSSVAINAGESPPTLTDVHRLSARDRTAAIAFVPQAVAATFGYTALQVVLMGRTAGSGVFSAPSRRDEAEAMQELARLGAEHLAHRSVAQMSGGEQRLVLIARALATNASILLLDEPTAHLDFRNQLIVRRLLENLAAERGITIAFSTHLPTDAFATASHALLMRRGSGHRFGEIAAIVTDQALQDAFAVRARVVAVDIEGTRNHVVVPVQPI